MCIFWSHGLQKNVFFRVHLYIWAVAGLEVGTYSNEPRVLIAIYRYLNKYTIHCQLYNNLRTFKFDNFSEFQNLISGSPPAHQRHYDALRTKIDM